MIKSAEHTKKAYLDTLRTHPLFALLPQSVAGETVKDELLDQVVIHEYAKSELIFIQHSVVENLYFLLDGQVMCYRELPSGQACLIASYHEMGLINESVLWGLERDDYPNFGTGIHQVGQMDDVGGQAPSKANIATRHSKLLVKERGIHQLTATAKCPTVVATLPVQAYFESIADFDLGNLIMWFCNTISKRMYYHLISSDLLAFVQAKSKLSYYFLTHYPVGVPFELPFSQKQLAGQIGLRPETLSRTLKELIGAGLITKRKSQYCLMDAERLLALVSD
ncbi:Crp/Fnr family transcriptional regulator [Moraxella lacunata]|uniref:Crp/Fnr family transcriptional regulator n=1 Tax=Moraxella lacunata TaxID=477 RepID=UPI0024AE6380|nr:Crp/Fnr family transcriptional regulator [Moraxella lacunata]